MGKNGTVVENWKHYCWSEVLEKEKELGCELYKERLAFGGQGTSFLWQ